MTRAKASPHPLRGEARGLIHPGPPPTESGDEASLTSWGFQDTEFAVDSSGAITVTGDRYPGLSGERMPELLPWFRTVVGIDFPLADEAPLRTAPVPPSRAAPAFLDAIKSVVDADAVRTDEHIRQRHGHGHTVAEIEAVRGDGLPRVPDYVVYPDSEAQVTAIAQAARSHGVVLMPCGGGTHVSEALRCLTDEERPIVAVDMSRMSRILGSDPVHRMTPSFAWPGSKQGRAAATSRSSSSRTEPCTVGPGGRRTSVSSDPPAPGLHRSNGSSSSPDMTLPSRETRSPPPETPSRDSTDPGTKLDGRSPSGAQRSE